VPVVAIVGQAATTAIGGNYQQEVDLQNLFKDVADAYLVMVTNPMQMRHAVDRAMRSALTRRSVSVIIVPKDVQEEAAIEEIPHKHDTIHTSVGYTAPRILPHDADLQRAADILNAGERVAMVVGAGAIGAEAALVATADMLGAGLAKALLGKSALPDSYPWVTGTIGLLGTRATAEMIAACDTLLLVGTNFPYSEFLPKDGAVKSVQIDIDAVRLGMRYAVDVNLMGDTVETLTALLPLLHVKTDPAWRERIAREKEKDAGITAARDAITGENGVNPENIFTTLSPLLPDNAIVTCDAGTSTNFAARYLQMRRGMKFSLSGGLATMGSAVPYAIAAKFAFPDRVAIALTGDGAMQMNGLNELITVARYWKTWSDPRIIFMVNNNRDLNQVTWEMRIESGEPKFTGSQSLPDVPYGKFAELLGFVGIRVERAEDLAAAWTTALAADRPVVLDIVTDPNISLLPPHITFEQARMLATALAHGDPDEGNVIVQSVKGVLAGLAPHKTDGDRTAT
jgi:pyruvate dehydrogenase (quinone)